MDVKREISEDLPLGGFAAAVGGYARKPLDLNELLVRNPPATFFARMSGDDMTGMGIGSGDILVVDRSAQRRRHRCSLRGKRVAGKAHTRC